MNTWIALAIFALLIGGTLTYFHFSPPTCPTEYPVPAAQSAVLGVTYKQECRTPTPEECAQLAGCSPAEWDVQQNECVCS